MTDAKGFVRSADTKDRYEGRSGMIRLALTDLDNTLIPLGAPHASARAIRAVHAMLDAGLWFGPVSGRVPAAMRWMRWERRTSNQLRAGFLPTPRVSK